MNLRLPSVQKGMFPVLFQRVRSFSDQHTRVPPVRTVRSDLFQIDTSMTYYDIDHARRHGNCIKARRVGPADAPQRRHEQSTRSRLAPEIETSNERNWW
jgi:hypothetical protein